MKKLLGWLDVNFLNVFAGFLLIFLPLYPKLPLFDILPGYIVRARVEDFLVAFLIAAFLFQLWRKKIQTGDNPLSKPLMIYFVIGALSLLSAIFITHTIPLQTLHIEKSVLHFLRRIEYISLFFIFFSTIRTLKQVKIYVGIVVLSALLVAIYGFGQKYLYWPAFSTMNREFSKGWVLYLTAHARVLSTFGGHYDLAAYLVIILTLLWSLLFSLKNALLKILTFMILASSFWLLILTASRTSFIAYLVGTSTAVFIWSLKRGIIWGTKTWVVTIFLSILVMLSFGDLSERFTKLLKIDERFGGLKELVLKPLSRPPTGKAIFLENNIAAVTSKSDMPPTPVKPGTVQQQRPIDVYEDIPFLEATVSGSGIATIAARPRTYSKTALMYDLSTAIRFDVLWPRAIAGFKKNPLLGSGYATLTKEKVTDFTEAESTDNDFLRNLGETGLLGFIFFYGSILLIVSLAFKSLNKLKDPLVFGIVAGLTGAIIGLLVNGLYIDVFEASKVAFIFWALMGLLLAIVRITKNEEEVKLPGILGDRERIQNWIKRFFKSDFPYLLGILFLAFILRTYKIDTPLADWHSWRQADTAAVTRNYLRYGVDLLHPRFDDLSSVASGKANPEGWRFVEFPIYNAASVLVRRIFPEYNDEGAMRLTSIFASLGSIIFLFLIVKRHLGRRTAYLSALFFTTVPYSIFFGRVILPEPSMVFASLGAIHFFDRWLNNSSSHSEQSEESRMELHRPNGILRSLSSFGMTWGLWFISLLFMAVAILIKPYAIFLFLPISCLAYCKWGLKTVVKPQVILFFVLSVIPFILWRFWMRQFPEGIPASEWLLNGDGIRFKGAFFRWLIGERMGKLILTVGGFSLFVLGLIRKTGEKEGWFFHTWLLSVLAYFTIFATGNVRHDYYQIMFVPIAAIFMAKGADLLLSAPREVFSRSISYLLFAICYLSLLAFGWFEVQGFYWINHPEIVEAGTAIDKITPHKALVIAPYNGDTAFLYQTKRRGWPTLDEPIEKLIKRGASYYVTTDPKDPTLKLVYDSTRHFKIVMKDPKFTIMQLVEDKDLPKD